MGNYTVTAQMNEVFRGLADPLRRRILALLQERARPVEEIASHFPVSRPAVSKHLRVLKEAGLISEERSGRQRFYALVPAELRPVSRWLEELLGGSAAREPLARGAGPSPRS